MSTLFEHAYVLDVMSDDHPGIIAAVGGAVGTLAGNIDACSQTVLGGYFTLIMIVSFPDPIEPSALAGKIAAREVHGSKLQVMARAFLSAGDRVEFGGLFGSASVIEVRNAGASEGFIRFGGRIPAPIQSLTN